MRKISNLQVTPKGVEEIKKEETLLWRVIKIWSLLTVALIVVMIISFGLIKLFLFFAETV